MAITINLAALGDGTYTIEDDGIAGNATSVVRDPAGNVVTTFAHPADSLTIVSRPGQSLDVRFSESLGTANFTVGSLTAAGERPDNVAVAGVSTSGTVTLTANGAITELGSDAAPDIVAGAVVFSAGTGVGTGANAIETATAVLEAETGTGGINLGNIGTLVVGTLTDEVAGLDVATSGNLRLTNVGTILLADVTGSSSVHGGATSGNVVLVASGGDADITSAVNRDAIAAMGGSVVLAAGRDVSLGTWSTDYDNDVRARDNLTIKAGRDVVVDGFADLASDGYGTASGGNVVITAGRDIGVLNATGTDGSVGAEGSAGGDVTLTTGAGGFVRLNAGAGALFSTSGDVTVNADHIAVSGTAGINANGGVVTLRPVTEGWGVDLGSATDGAFALELSDAELDRIFAATLNVGGADAGPVRVVSDLSPASVANLTLVSGTDIWIGAGITVTQQLSLFAGDNLLHVAGSLVANVLAGQVDNAGEDAGVGGFGGFGGVTAGTITLAGRAEADILRGAEDVAQEVHGRGGADTIHSSGEGSYYGDGDDDILYAGLSSGIVPELLDGGAGIDTLDASSYSGSYVIDLATGTTNFGYESFVNFENLVTGEGNDQVTGTADANVMRTAGGDDTLVGAGGDDDLNGGAGQDLLDGGAGKDLLRGGGARDVFQFRDGDLGATRALSDVVADFSQASNEKIHLGLVDANTNAAGNQAFTWIGSGAFTGVARQLHYVQQGGKTFVEGDTDGDGSADFCITLTGTINLVEADIVL